MMTDTEQRIKQPSEILRGITGSAEFLEQRNRRTGGAVLQEVLSPIEAAAKRMADDIKRENYGYDNDESRQLRLVGVLPSFIKSQRQLDVRRDDMSSAEYRNMMEPVDELNHLMREMIDSEQITKRSETVQFVKEILLRNRAPVEIINYAAGRTHDILTGMCNEIASESVIRMIPGVDDVESATDRRDESLGRDLVVYGYRGIDEIPIDIKTSPFGIRKSEQQSIYLRPSGAFVLQSGFSSEDFGDALIPDIATLKSKIPYYTKQLDEAAMILKNNLDRPAVIARFG